MWRSSGLMRRHFKQTKSFCFRYFWASGENGSCHGALNIPYQKVFCGGPVGYGVLQGMKKWHDKYVALITWTTAGTAPTRAGHQKRCDNEEPSTQHSKRHQSDASRCSSRTITITSFATKTIDVFCRESKANGSDMHAEKRLAAAREFAVQDQSSFSAF